MYALGLDIGMKTVKAVLLGSDSERQLVLPGEMLSIRELADRARDELCADAGITPSEIGCTMAVGFSTEDIPFATEHCSEPVALARGINSLLSGVHTVIDLGLRTCSILNCAEGRVTKTTSGTRCASGTGSFLDMFSVFLDLDFDTMSAMYFRSQCESALQTRCTIFAESEVISLIHEGRTKEDIVRSIFKSLAQQVAGYAYGVDVTEDVALVGGLANSAAFVDALSHELGVPVLVPAHFQSVSALGAAIVARRRIGEGGQS